jgi:large subunit ribosomal protein L6
MSRIGNKVVIIPEGVSVNLEGTLLTVKGPKGELKLNVNPELTIEINGNELVVKRPSDSREHRAMHGTTRALINNMVVGVSAGFEKVLEIEGVGYRAQMQGNVLVVSAGYSHPVNMPVPAGLTVTCATPTEIHIVGADKQVVGEFAAEVRQIRKPEPYKGKGIHYRGEYIRRKEGKKAK